MTVISREVVVACSDDLADHGWADAVVAIDVIRATTTLATAIARGRRCYPVASVKAGLALAARLDRPLLAGELGGLMPEGFHLNNSPAEFAARHDVWRPAILLTTSGCRLLASAAAGQRVLAACLRNWSATVRRLADSPCERVALVGAGTHGEFRSEDQLCCSMIAAGLVEHGFRVADEDTRATLARWRDVPVSAIANGHSAEYLRRSGQEADLRFVLEHVDDVDMTFALEGWEVVREQLLDRRRAMGVEHAA